MQQCVYTTHSDWAPLCYCMYKLQYSNRCYSQEMFHSLDFNHCLYGSRVQHVSRPAMTRHTDGLQFKFPSRTTIHYACEPKIIIHNAIFSFTLISSEECFQAS